MHLRCTCSSQDKDLGAVPRVLALGDDCRPPDVHLQPSDWCGQELVHPYPGSGLTGRRLLAPSAGLPGLTGSIRGSRERETDIHVGA